MTLQQSECILSPMTTRSRYRDEDEPRSTTRRKNREYARDEIAYDREMQKEADRAAGRSTIRNVDEKRAAQKQRELDEQAVTNKQLLSEGKRPIDFNERKSTLKDLRQDPNKTAEQIRDEKTRSGAFGKTAQKSANIKDRQSLFADMQKGGDMGELRKRATALGVDQKGWDIAQARIADKTRAQTAEEEQVFGKAEPTAGSPVTTAGVATTAAPKGSTPYLGKAGIDLGASKGGAASRGEDTSDDFLTKFSKEADQIGNTFMQTDATTERLAKEANMAELDKKIAADASAVATAQNKRLLDAETKGNELTALRANRDAVAGAQLGEINKQAGIISDAENRMFENQKAIDVRDRNKLSPGLQTAKNMAYASGIGAPLAATYDIATAMGNKLEDARRAPGGSKGEAASTLMEREGLASATDAAAKQAASSKATADRLEATKQTVALGKAEREMARQTDKEKAAEEEAKRKQTVAR